MKKLLLLGLLLAPSLGLAQDTKSTITNKLMGGYGVPDTTAGYLAGLFAGGNAVTDNNTYVKARNAAGSANINVWKVDGSDNTNISTGTSKNIYLNATSVVTGATSLDADVSAPFNAASKNVAVTNGADPAYVMLGIGSSGYEAYGARTHFIKTRSTSVTGDANTIVQSGDELGQMMFWGANGTGYSTGAIIKVTVDAAPGATTDMPGAIDFQVSPDGSATPASALKLSNNKYALFGADAGFVSGGTIAIQEATAGSACSGTLTANGATPVVVSTSCAKTGSRIFLSRTSAETGAVNAWKSALSDGVSFSVTGEAADTGTYDWFIVHEAP